MPNPITLPLLRMRAQGNKINYAVNTLLALEYLEALSPPVSFLFFFLLQLSLTPQQLLSSIPQQPEHLKALEPVWNLKKVSFAP